MNPQKPPRLLYIEDDRGLGLLLKKRLERLGYTVDLADNGEEGLAMYRPGCHDVIAVDQNMPGLDGLDVIKVLATYNPVPPIVMITGTGDQRVAVEAMKLGARDYIVKDVEGGYLELMPSVIDQVLYQQQLVDEKRRAEETLRQSEERYRSLVELSPDGIVVYHDDQFVYVNHAALSLLQANSPDDLLGCDVQQVIHPDYRSSVWDRLERTQEFGEPVTLLESKLIRFDGQVIDVEIMAAPIMFENRKAAQMLIREVTERKHAEEARLESEYLRTELDKEKELSDLKSRLMITISHEFRTPLSIAYSSAELLEKFYERMSSSQREEHLHRIETQINSLTGLLEDISLIIHATFERLVLHLELTDLKALCAATLAQAQASEQAQQTLVMNASEDFPNLMLNLRRIKYIVTNLLSNAIKYSDADSAITLDLVEHEDYIVIQVSDQGIGIPPEDQARIFEPFYRAHNVGTVRGTGLGLSIVKEIVEMHQGTISLRSAVNQGTQIVITLPKRQQVA